MAGGIRFSRVATKAPSRGATVKDQSTSHDLPRTVPPFSDHADGRWPVAALQADGARSRAPASQGQVTVATLGCGGSAGTVGAGGLW